MWLPSEELGLCRPKPQTAIPEGAPVKFLNLGQDNMAGPSGTRGLRFPAFTFASTVSVQHSLTVRSRKLIKVSNSLSLQA